MSLPVIAYVLQPDQVIFTPTTENGPLPGIYAASDFIAKWRDWDAGTAGGQLEHGIRFLMQC